MATDPVIFIPAQNSVEATDKLPAGYKLTGQAMGDTATGAKLYRAVQCQPDQEIYDCVRLAEARLKAQQGQDAVYEQAKKASNAEVRRVQQGLPEPAPDPTSPAGQRVAEEQRVLGVRPGDYNAPLALAVVVVATVGVLWYLSR